MLSYRENVMLFEKPRWLLLD